MGTRPLVILFCSLALSFSAWGQVDTIISSDADWRREAAQILADTNHSLNISQRLNLAGFWLHQIKDKQLVTGPKLQIGSLQILVPEGDTLKPRIPANVNLNDSSYRALLKSQLLFYENQGYPFAAFRLMDYHLEGNRLQAKLLLDKGLLVQFDSITVLGYTDINRKLLEREIGWLKNAPYQESYLQNIGDYLGRVEYLEMSRPPAVGFIQDRARLYLYLSKRASNLINGVVGLNTDNQGNSTLTGDFRLRLLNLFNRGEGIDLRWQSPSPGSQDFNIALLYPYIWNTPLGLKGSLEIFRQDSSFVKQNFQLSFPYRLARGASMRLGFQILNSSPLGDGNTSLRVEEVQNLRYLLGFELDRRNDAIVSTKGYYIDISLGSGRRTRLSGETQQYLWEGQFQYFLPLYKGLHWHQDLRTAGLSGDALQDNELYRLGGINSLRGFNEWSFFSPSYALLRSEFRYMLGRYDYLSALFDFALAERNGLEVTNWDRHTGLGLGLNFQTKGGIFSLIFATGQSNNTAYDLRAGKIHLAYVNRF
jgi:outer membrane protein assembly factor BamA